jgi:hypothetical protein
MLRKDDDKVGGDFQVRLVFICPQWGESVEPLFGSTSVVEAALLFFRHSKNLSVYLCITDDYKMPGLLIGAARSASRNAQAILDHLPRNGT